MKTFFIEAIDTLFFRDGRPFEVGGEANLQIPPSPSTFYGALRSAILAAEPDVFSAFMSGKDQTLKEWIGEYGDSEGTTAKLSLKGPLFAKRSGEQIVRFFPLPKDVLIFTSEKDCEKDKEEENRRSSQFLVPTKLKQIPENLETNMKLTHLLVNPYSQTAEYENVLISETLLQQYLSGDLKQPHKFTFGEEVFQLDEVYTSDFREGIALKKGQKNVETGRLFTMQHMVLTSDNEKQMGFVFECELPDSFSTDSILRLGGDGKVAYLQSVNVKPFPIEPIKEHIEHTRLFKVYLATPALFEMGPLSRAMYNGYFEEFPGLKFELIAAAIGRPEMYGGYDIVANVPKVSFPAVPAGSVYYFKLKEGRADDVLQAFHGRCISDFRQNQGFGYSFVGGIYNV
ncbi:MAG: type III-B CRISPR module-associated protein Cmr3 [Calditrichia bacterium]